MNSENKEQCDRSKPNYIDNYVKCKWSKILVKS